MISATPRGGWIRWKRIKKEFSLSLSRCSIWASLHAAQWKGKIKPCMYAYLTWDLVSPLYSISFFAQRLVFPFDHVQSFLLPKSSPLFSPRSNQSFLLTICKAIFCAFNHSGRSLLSLFESEGPFHPEWDHSSVQQLQRKSFPDRARLSAENNKYLERKMGLSNWHGHSR